MALSEFPRLGFDPFLELRRMQSEMGRVFTGLSPAFRDFPPINHLARRQQLSRYQ
jgi:HSP20 family protein